MLLCIEKSLSRYNVELHVHTLLVKVGTDECGELHKTAHALKCGGMELLVKKRTVGCNALLQLCNRVCGRGGTLHIPSGCGADTVGKRSVCKSAVRGSTGGAAKRNVRRYGVKSRLENTATGVFVLLYLTGVAVRHVAGKHIHLVDIVTVLGTILVDCALKLSVSCLGFCGKRAAGGNLVVNGADRRLVNLDALSCKLGCNLGGEIECRRAGKTVAEVGLQCLSDLGKGVLLLLKNKLSYRNKTVGVVRNSEALRTGEVVDCATLLQGLSSADTVIDHTALEGERTSYRVCNVDCVVCVYKQLYHIALLCLIGIVELFKRGHFLNRLGIHADFHALVHTRVEGKLHRAAHVEECRIVPSVGLVGSLRLNTSDDTVITGILKGKAARHNGRNNNLVIIICGKTGAKAGKSRRLNHKAVGCAVPDSDGNGGLGQRNVHRRLNTHIGKVVGCVKSVNILSTDDKVLEHTVAGKSVRGCGIPDLVYIVELNPYAVDKLLCLLTGDDTRVNILLVVGIHVLVKATGRDGVTRGLNLQKQLNKPEGLACLVEALCTEFGHTCAVSCYLFKLRATVLALLNLRHISCKARVSARVLDNRLTALDNRGKEVGAAYVIGVGYVKLIHRRLCLGNDTAVANLQNLAVVNADVTDTVVEVVTGGEYRVLGECVIRLGRHICLRKVGAGLTVPPGIDCAKDGLVLLTDIEGVCRTGCHGIKLCLKPFVGILGEHLTSAGCNGCTADDKLVIADNDGNIFKNVGECCTAALDDGKVLRRLVALGYKHTAGGLDFGHLLIKCVNKLADSCTLFNYKFYVFHNPSFRWFYVNFLLKLSPQLLVRCGDNRRCGKRCHAACIFCTRLGCGGNVTNLTNEEDNALSTHTAGDTKVVNLDTGGLNRDIRRLDCTCRREGLNKTERAACIHRLCAEEGGNYLLIDATHNGAVNHISLES